jgi:hypothetical protein
VAAHKKRKATNRGVIQAEATLWSYLIYYTAYFLACQMLSPYLPLFEPGERALEAGQGTLDISPGVRRR